ncbi:MAG: hypothetical protein IJQ89_04650 [Bacteroidales bacterium]|nr:hypothetical protein [Bacteroidales bacterium]
MRIRILITILLTIVIATNLVNKTEAQTYYGDNGKGKFIILNDSIGIGYFKAGIGVDHWIWVPDTFSLRRSNDTLHVSSLRPKQYIHLKKSDFNLKIESAYDLLSISLYSYNKEFETWTIERMGGWSDTAKRITFVREVYLRKYRLYILVTESVVGSERYSFYCDSTGIYDIEIDFGMKDVVLKEMPLLVRGTKLIPASDSLQTLCWAENGFFLPIMKEKKKTIYVKPLLIWSQRNKNLPNNSNDRSFMPSRYFKYLKQTGK